MHPLNFIAKIFKCPSVSFIAIAILLGSFNAISIGFASDSSVIATVGSKNITVDEFNRRYAEMVKQTNNPPPKKVFLEDLVRYEVGVQEAEKMGLEKDPIIAERMKEELYKGFIEKQLSEKINGITVNEEEMKEIYKTSPEIRTSHILIELKQNATPAERAAAKKRAEEIYAEVRKSKQPFEKLVKLYSDDLTTKNNGGDVGYQSRLTVVPSYYEAVSKLTVGEMTGVVETPFGFHIVKLTGKHTYGESQKRNNRAAVYEKKRLAAFNDFFDKLKKKYKISTNAELIGK
jgi:parvulin-like peptidyl-prolyl isomerase